MQNKKIVQESVGHTLEKHKKEEIEHLVSVKINDACLDPEGGDCPCVKHEVKTRYNPI